MDISFYHELDHRLMLMLLLVVSRVVETILQTRAQIVQENQAIKG